MHPISEREFTTTAKHAFEKVFGNPDPFGSPFRPEVKPRLLLCRLNYTVHGVWVEPFLAGLRNLNEGGFYVSVLDRPPEAEQRRPYHWHVDIEEFDTYSRGLDPLENAAYSEQGRWGLIASHEDFAMIAGPSELIGQFERAIPDLDQRIVEFLDLWASYHLEKRANVKWIRPMLIHLFGLRQAEGYLARSRIHGYLDKD